MEFYIFVIGPPFIWASIPALFGSFDSINTFTSFGSYLTNLITMYSLNACVVYFSLKIVYKYDKMIKTPCYYTANHAISMGLQEREAR